MSRAESRAWANSLTLVIPVVEDTRAVQNLDGILSAPGVDVLHVASGDLGQSMGNRCNRHSLPRRVGATRHGLLFSLKHSADGRRENERKELMSCIMAPRHVGAERSRLYRLHRLGSLRLGAEAFRKRVDSAL